MIWRARIIARRVGVTLTLAVTIAGAAVALHARASADALAGGDATVFDDSRNAYSLAAPNLSESHRPAFFVGNSFFNQNWVIAPASTRGRDGLGPLFNERSCSGCHFKDGRGRPPEAGEPLRSMLVRIGIPGTGEHGAPLPDPVYGDQIQGAAIPGVVPEADVLMDYTEQPGRYADGEPYSLRQPSYRITNPGYGPPASPLLMSPRVAPAMIGLGLLEAIADAVIEQRADPNDRDRDGVSGRVNHVWDVRRGAFGIGRFGWKAEQPTIRQQVAAAFNGDIGITTTLFPRPSHTGAETSAANAPSGGDPELRDEILDAVTLYARALAVPAARTADDAEATRGRALFAAARCTACHVPDVRTGSSSDLPEMGNQTIRPFTDLLLHDMGDALADHRPVFDADGREWRTPPLWGIGLLHAVNGHTTLLHDGRARGVAEAVLWHGGEAAASRERFRSMTAGERRALIAFVESL